MWYYEIALYLSKSNAKYCFITSLKFFDITYLINVIIRKLKKMKEKYLTFVSENLFQKFAPSKLIGGHFNPPIIFEWLRQRILS